MISPEQRLWQAVVYKAFIDALGDDSKDRDAMRAKREADAWIRDCRRDFRQVCALAGMDPDFLSQAYNDGRVDRDLLKA